MIEFVRITTKEDPLLEKMEETYIESFPYEERRDIPKVEDLLVNNPFTTVNAILSDGEYAGFLTYWTFEDFIYAEHFGIDKRLRNAGIGGAAFFKFVSEAPLPMVGEVEAPVDDLTRRRVDFYTRMGLRFYNRIYLHPAFHKGGKKIDVCMVSYGDIDVNKEFDRIEKYLYKYVYPKEGLE